MHDDDALCNFINQKWQAIIRIQQALKPAYQATIVMQKADFCMSDLYASLNQVERNIKKILKRYPDDSLASSLQICLTARKPQLFDKPAMSCALALDPRFFYGEK